MPPTPRLATTWCVISVRHRCDTLAKPRERAPGWISTVSPRYFAEFTDFRDCRAARSPAQMRFFFSSRRARETKTTVFFQTLTRAPPRFRRAFDRLRFRFRRRRAARARWCTRTSPRSPRSSRT